MKLNVVNIIAVFTLVCILSCSTTKDQKSELSPLQQILATPIKTFENYKFDPNSPIIDRVQPVPDFVLKQLREWFKADEFVNYDPTESDMAEIAKCIELLPDLNRRILEKHLLGFYFVENFPGGGITDLVLDKHGNRYSFTVFNPDILNHGLSEQVSKKEISCFIMDDPGMSVEIDCGRDYSGFLYGLVHETVHIVDGILNISPYVVPWAKDLDNTPAQTPFVKDIWVEYFKPAQQYDYSYRENVTFYGMRKGPKINITEAAEVYKQLAATPFVSLYGSDSWAEDLAEFVMYYHFTRKMNLPYEIKVIKKDSVLYRYEPMENEIVQKRFGLMEQFYE